MIGDLLKNLFSMAIEEQERRQDTSWIQPGVKAWMGPCQVGGPDTLVTFTKVEREPCYHTDPAKCPIKPWGITVRWADGREGIPMATPECFKPYKEG